jgi:hypothetical protein
MNAKVAIVVVFLAAAGGIFYYTSRGRPEAPGGRSGASAARTGDAAEITVLYSTEKQAWMEAAVAAFMKEHQEIKVTLVGKGSLDGAQAILEGKAKPTIFSPADSLVLNMLTSDWQVKNPGSALFAQSGDDAPQPLVISPLVFVVWEDRANVLLKASGGNVSWKAIRKAVASNQGWPAVGGSADWGFVKLGHTDPTRSNSGLQALWLMTLEFYGKKPVEIGDLLRPDYQAWVRDLEKGVTKFEASTGTFMTDMVRFGPSKYDIAVVYESLAIAQLENAQGRWGALKVYYPGTTLWSDHPVAIAQADWVTDAQRQAARAFIAHLRSRTWQERALGYGFRPADPAVPLKTADAQNPFTRLQQYGIQVSLPPVAKTPEGALVRNLLTMWSRVTAAR